MEITFVSGVIRLEYHTGSDRTPGNRNRHDQDDSQQDKVRPVTPDLRNRTPLSIVSDIQKTDEYSDGKYYRLYRN